MNSPRLHLGIVGIDQWLGGAIYTQNLIKALAQLPTEECPHITLFCRKPEFFGEVTPLVNKVVVFESRLDRAFGHTPLATTMHRIDHAASVLLFRDVAPALGRAAQREKVDAIFPVPDPYTRLTPNPIAWIPDLQHCVFPQNFSRAARRVRDDRFSSLLHDSSRHVVFSSHCTHDHAARVYGPSKAKTYVLHFCTVPLQEWSADPTPVLTKYQLVQPFFIVCNQFWVHKDHLTIFRGMAKLRQQGVKINVICTGPTHDPRQPEYFSRLEAEIRNLSLEQNVRILGMIPRTDQILLMRSALAVLQPSKFEGWSTVIEDARVLGTPVIASDFPVHLEQDAPGSYYFRTGDSEDFASAIQCFLEKEPITVRPPEHLPSAVGFARAFLDIVNSAYPRLRQEPLSIGA